MEFKYCDGQNRRTSSPLPHPLSAVSYISRCPLQGCEFGPSGFPSNVSTPKVFPTSISVNANEAFQQELEKEHIQRELEKEEIRREIIIGEMALARRRELEEEVRKEMASERAFRIPMQRSEGISFRDPVFNNMLVAPQFHLFSHSQVDNKQAHTQINKDKVTILAKPNVDRFGGKRKVVTPAVNESESLQKKAKQEWICDLCKITTTSEKGLNDHIQGKKHKAKEASTRSQKIGLDSRLDSQTLKPSITPADTGKLESREEDQAIHKSNGLGCLDNQNEIATSKEARETNTLTKKEEI